MSSGGVKKKACCKQIPQAVSYAVLDFELHICLFRSQKRKTLLMQSKYAKYDRNFFENPMAQVVGFWAKI